MATMKDVARLAGVSTSTVSHVINNDRYVSPSMRTRIETAIKVLNYAPSALGRNLKMKTTRTIGMLMTNSNNPFFSEVVQGVEHSCYELGYNLIICNTEGDSQRMYNNLEALLQKSVDGILSMCEGNQSLPDDIFSRYPALPIVMMDWSPFTDRCDIIQDNSLDGAILATRYLIEQGYRRIACIAGPSNNTQAQRRLTGYYQALQQAGLSMPTRYQVAGDFRFASGAQAMHQLLKCHPRPDAVFCSNDAMAIGAYQALYQQGLLVGQDIALIGYDDIEFAAFMNPPLTTIHQPKQALGQLAVETLLERMQNSDAPLQILTLTPELVIRSSA